MDALLKAVVVVYLYGQCADIDPLVEVCGRFEVPLIEDAAETLGGLYRGKPAGTFGLMGVCSLNGNKIITSSLGGILISETGGYIERALSLATKLGIHFPITNTLKLAITGYNYSLNNVCAAVARAPSGVLGDRVAPRRRVFDDYRDALADFRGISFMPEQQHGDVTHDGSQVSL